MGQSVHPIHLAKRMPNPELTPTHDDNTGPRQFIARLEKDFPGQSHLVRNDMVLLLVMAGNDYLKVRFVGGLGPVVP